MFYLQWQNAELLNNSLTHIAQLLDDFGAGKEIERDTLARAQKEMQENLDSVESILICASHQGRIADGELSLPPSVGERSSVKSVPDILNVSKLVRSLH